LEIVSSFDRGYPPNISLSITPPEQFQAQSIGTQPAMTALSQRFVTVYELHDSEYDLIDFLAFAQSAGLIVLPITWQSAKELAVGKGGTSHIYEAPFSGSMFAFKRVLREHKREISRGNITEGVIFKALIDEIAVLCHPNIQSFPGIVNIEGISWDISKDDEL
jgi:hypothetical protein